MIAMLCHYSCIYLEHQWINVMSGYQVEAVVGLRVRTGSREPPEPVPGLPSSTGI